MKTNGQRLYEHKSQPMLRVVPVGVRFPTADDVILVKNDSHIPWQFLTQRCKDSWEASAVGHHLLTKEST